MQKGRVNLVEIIGKIQLFDYFCDLKKKSYPHVDRERANTIFR